MWHGRWFNHADRVHDNLVWGMFALGIPTFAALMLGISAPYGRYSRQGWGLMINARVAWMVQELPSLLVPSLLCAMLGAPSLLHHPTSVPSLGLATFMTHYAYRSCVFPWLLRGGKHTPVSIMMMAFSFTTWNGFVQGWQLLVRTPQEQPLEAVAAMGFLTWMVGFGINIHSDHVLRNLRVPGGDDKGYKIPQGGMFSCVSAANYFGEIMEWFGWAVALRSWSAAAFAFYTFCNLAPRGHAHHKWYVQKFENYPPTRRAILPFVW